LEKFDDPTEKSSTQEAKTKTNTTLLEKFDDPTEQSSTQEAKTIPPTQTHERSLSWLNWYTHFK
jgi:hypothetical protein